MRKNMQNVGSAKEGRKDGLGFGVSFNSFGHIATR